MNVYAWIILIALVAEYVIGTLASVLNLRAASATVPAEFRGVYDPDAYEKSQRYLTARTRLGMLTTTYALGLVLLFWSCRGFPTLDQLVRSSGFGPVVTGLFFMGALTVGYAFLFLPFTVYSTFVIERHFGFNRTTVATFVMDLVKGLLLSIVLGGPILGVILVVLGQMGARAWLVCWGVTAAYTMCMQTIVPVWIMPLFNTFEPLEEGDLRQELEAYLAEVSFPVGGLFVIDGSRRSSHSNAFVAGIGRTRRIALFDTLVERHTVPELLAIVGHEIGHWRKHHIMVSTLVSIARSGVMFYLLSLFLTHRGLFTAFFMPDCPVYAGLVFFGMLYSPVEMVLSVAMNALSRRHEFAADRFAADGVGAEAMASALKRLSVDNLANLTPHWLKVLLDYSHPPLPARLRAIAGEALDGDKSESTDQVAHLPETEAEDPP